MNTSFAGLEYSRPFGPLVMHFFNHQTHRRAQAAARLSQSGIDMGSTGVPTIVPEAQGRRTRG